MGNVLAGRAMRVCRAERGGISLFLAVVMLAVVILSGLLVDTARLGAAKNQTARALDIATLSVLAGYETDLKNEYGLFALNMPTPDPSVLTAYAGLNLGIDDGGGELLGGLLDADTGRRAKLYDFQIEHIDMSTGDPLSDVNALERQILEYMKYRAPAALATGAADFIKQAQTAAKMADTTKIKVEIDRKLGEIGREQQNLRDYLFGDVGTARVGTGYVNNLNRRNNRGELAGEIVELYGEYTSAKRAAHEAELARRGSPDPAASQSDRDAVNEARAKLAGAWDILHYNETEAFLKSNQGAIGCVNKIADVSVELRALYEKLDESVTKFDAGELSEQFTEPLLADAERGRASLIDAQSAGEKIGKLNENARVITTAVSGLNAMRQKVFNYNATEAPISSGELERVLMPDFSAYHYDITYEYRKAERRSGFADPREFVGDRVSELLGDGERDAGEKKLSDIGINASELPSHAGLAYSLGWPPAVDIDYSHSDMNSDFSENSLESVRSIGDVLADGLENLRNMYYTGEYVLSVFENATGDEYRWAGAAAPDKIAFFDAEAEYILHGNDKQSGNIFWTKAQLLVTRFAMNFIHVHSDPEKLNFAMNTASALTAWWSSGALVPIVMDVIIAAWSIKEAIADVDDLFDGKRVAFIKLAGDWKTNIGVPAENKPKTREEHKWSYIDYLRIYLLLTPRQTKLTRISDLIEINTRYAGRGLRVKDLYCAVRSDIEVSVNYLFMTAPFMPPSMKTERDRHILKATASRDLY